jgi:hypothetical protein
LTNTESFELELEVDPALPLDELLRTGGTWELPGGDVQIVVRPLSDGHGFGLEEVVTISIMVGAGAASELVADAIRLAIKGVIRKVRSSKRESDGSRKSLTEMVEKERNGKDQRSP